MERTITQSPLTSGILRRLRLERQQADDGEIALMDKTYRILFREAPICDRTLAIEKWLLCLWRYQLDGGEVGSVTIDVPCKQSNVCCCCVGTDVEVG
jgi:hypothetical protein